MTRQASEVLAEALAAALSESGGLNGAYEGAPVQASLPYALVDCGAERDWSHKSGEGRELRVAVTIRAGGERPDALRAAMARAETAVAGLGAALDGWRLVSLIYLSSRRARDGKEWAGAIDWRARLLRTD